MNWHSKPMTRPLTHLLQIFFGESYKMLLLLFFCFSCTLLHRLCPNFCILLTHTSDLSFYKYRNLSRKNVSLDFDQTLSQKKPEDFTKNTKINVMKSPSVQRSSSISILLLFHTNPFSFINTYIFFMSASIYTKS